MTSVLITLALSAGAHSDTQTSRRLCKTLTSFSQCKCPALFQGQEQACWCKTALFISGNSLFQYATFLSGHSAPCFGMSVSVKEHMGSGGKMKTADNLTKLHCHSTQLLKFTAQTSNKQKLIYSSLSMQQYLKSHPVLSKTGKNPLHSRAELWAKHIKMWVGMFF